LWNAPYHWRRWSAKCFITCTDINKGNSDPNAL
jgi:hypothetical protein